MEVTHVCRRCHRTSSYLFPSMARKRLLYSSLFHHSFCYISRNCVYAHTRTHNIFRLLCLCFTWDGRDCTGAHAPHRHGSQSRPFIGGNEKAMCSPCAGELSNRREESDRGSLTDDSSSSFFSLPQPAFDLVVYPPSHRLHYVREGRGCFWLCPLLEAHFMLVCSFSFVIIFGKSYSTGRASLSSSTPTAHTWQRTLGTKKLTNLQACVKDIKKTKTVTNLRQKWSYCAGH